MCFSHNFIYYTFVVLLLNCMVVLAQESTAITGKVIDQNGYEVPYAAVGILQKNIGTTSTEDGTFYFRISKNEFDDNLTISSLGFSNFSIKIKDFLRLEKKEIVLEEQTTNLSEVVVSAPGFYVKNALKKLKENTINKNHQLNILYRRWSVEDELCRFYIEHFINMIDRGPSSYMVGFEVSQKRVSADYRFVKNKAPLHQIIYMINNDPLRRGLSIKDYSWQKKEPTNYDDEDVLVIEGTKKNKDRIQLYIGLDSYKIYKMDVFVNNPNPGKSMESTYVYKKNSSNKLFLSYFVKEWKGGGKLTENVKQALVNSGKKARSYIPIAYRHEAYVLEVIEDKKKFVRLKESFNKDMSDYDVSYDASFWKNISLPPETKFFLNNKEELESHFGAPLETQFKYAN